MKVLPSRYFGRATGQHRKPRPDGAVVDTEFARCPTCQVDTAVTRHGDIVRCTENHQIGGAS